MICTCSLWELSQYRGQILLLNVWLSETESECKLIQCTYSNPTWVVWSLVWETVYLIMYKFCMSCANTNNVQVLGVFFIAQIVSTFELANVFILQLSFNGLLFTICSYCLCIFCVFSLYYMQNCLLSIWFLQILHAISYSSGLILRFPSLCKSYALFLLNTLFCGHFYLFVSSKHFFLFGL